MGLNFGYTFFETLNTKIIRPNHRVRPNRCLDRTYVYSGNLLQNEKLNEFYTNDVYLGYFIRRTMYHRYLVNQFAEISGVSFPLHDFDKFSSGPKEIAAWSMYSWMRNPDSNFKPNENIIVDHTGKPFDANQYHTEYWKNSLDHIGESLEKRHKLINSHHPEFWEYIWLMPKLSMLEMIDDYCAMGAEKLTDGQLKPPAVEDAHNYFTNKKLDKFDWTKSQLKFIESQFAKLLRSTR